MSDDKQDFLEVLKDAAERAGFGMMSDAEFEVWLAKSDAYHKSPEGQAKALTQEMALDWCLDHATYRFTPSMGEISGFGGGYEKTCRVMLDAGLRWLDAHPDADPQFQGYKNMYGVISEENEDAKGLSKAVGDAVDDCTGAMHQAVVSSCLWIRKNGWERYVEEMSKTPKEASDAPR